MTPYMITPNLFIGIVHSYMTPVNLQCDNNCGIDGSGMVRSGSWSALRERPLEPTVEHHRGEPVTRAVRGGSEHVWQATRESDPSGDKLSLRLTGQADHRGEQRRAPKRRANSSRKTGGGNREEH